VSSPWKFLVTYITHSRFVPPDLAELDTVDLTSRGARPEIKSVTSGFFDLPKCFVSEKRKVFSVDLEGLRLEMPCAQWAEIYGTLSDLEEQRFSDGSPYYELYGMFKCVVLTPAQRNSMLAQMKPRLDEARLIRDQEQAEMRETLERINAKGGVQLASKKFPSTWPVGTEVDFTK
jgi:hypothetical protein